MSDIKTTETEEVTFPLPKTTIRRLLSIANQDSNHSASVQAIKVLIKEGVDVDAFIKSEEEGEAVETETSFTPLMDSEFFKKLAGANQ
ncbi:hypothetical protein [Vibrio paucivorans]|uniref:Uncharacterized protein n=1 Tax=Vibrio paucivorans TaxID=2829489 RepID=A0A9X3CII0_9VIBR|nr:hypothetical protein [Vibrio paucivorans]MCW8336467.1 hypothetical protein [Vibrio paucivorans]